MLPNRNLWWLWLGRSCVTGPIQQIQRSKGGTRNSMMVFRCFTTTMMPIQQLPSLLLLLAIRTNRCRAALRASTDMHEHRAASHTAKLGCIEGGIRIRVPASWSVTGHGVPPRCASLLYKRFGGNPRCMFRLQMYTHYVVFLKLCLRGRTAQ